LIFKVEFVKRGNSGPQCRAGQSHKAMAMLSAIGGRTNVLKIGILGIDSLWNHPDGDDDQQSLHLVFRADVR
jgi:hypothetical protein